MVRSFWIAGRVLLVFTLLTGALYPLVVTAAAHAFWPAQAEGSLLTRDGRTVGAQRVGQPFADARYLWGRPSATTPVAYNAAASTGSNLGPANPALVTAVRARVADLRAAHPAQHGPVPADLVTTSASGLDPAVTEAAAAFQVERVAQARHQPVAVVRSVLASCREPSLLGVVGPVQVNVLCVNLALDALPARP